MDVRCKKQAPWNVALKYERNPQKGDFVLDRTVIHKFNTYTVFQMAARESQLAMRATLRSHHFREKYGSLFFINIGVLLHSLYLMTGPTRHQ